jgi:replication initiator protein
MNDDPVEIQDEDLLCDLENSRGSPAFGILERHLADIQRKRNEAKARRSAMTPVQRRRDTAREVIASGDLKSRDRYHVHSVLALCGLPYRRPADDATDYVREYGRNSLVVQSGYLKDPISGKMVRQGLPYGPKARLLMLHICTMAIRQNSADIEIADSMSAFIRELGFQVTAGRRERLAFSRNNSTDSPQPACKSACGMGNGPPQSIANPSRLEAFDIWLPRDPDQKTLWSTKIHLDQKFYSSLKEHALPVDIRAIRSFANSAKQIDIILWLGYRLRTVKRSYEIKWSLLHDQFGSSVGRIRRFKEDFREDLKAIMEVFSKLPVKLTETGLLLMPCDVESLFVIPKKALSKR